MKGKQKLSRLEISRLKIPYKALTCWKYRSEHLDGYSRSKKLYSRPTGRIGVVRDSWS